MHNLRSLLLVSIAFIAGVCFYSCATRRDGLPKSIYYGRDIISNSKTAKDIRKKAKQNFDTAVGIPTAVSILNTLVSNSQTTIAAMKQSNSAAEKVKQEKQNAILFNPQAAQELQNNQRSIDSSNAAIIKELKVNKKKAEDILLFLNPDSLDKLLDSIVTDKLVEYSKTKNFLKITQAEKDSISKAARAEVEKMVEEKYAEIIKTEGDIKLLILKRDFVTIQEKVLAANYTLQKLAVTASNNLYYDSGQDTLADDQKKILIKNIGVFFNGMFDTLKNALSIIADDTTQYLGQLKIFADGYADPVEYSIIDSYNNNDSLSQRRADKIIKILEGVYSNKKKAIRLENVGFLNSQAFAVGHGTNYPHRNNDEDPKKRTCILRFTFWITLKN